MARPAMKNSISNLYPSTTVVASITTSGLVDIKPKRYNGLNLLLGLKVSRVSAISSNKPQFEGLSSLRGIDYLICLA